ncbi:MAG: hypothetical protein GY799_14490 [Desulfobulbaceae bacterium]|nr:hypothetical protein [Desulfobulbaceae bacterium]
MNTAGQNLTEAGFYVEQAEGGSPKDFLDRFFNTPWRLVHLYVPAEVGQPAEEGESFAGSIHIGRDIFFSTSEFKELRQLPEIVIIHAWPQPGRSFATNWGSELYKIGINVVLVNDWPLSEETAQIFLETFYQVLLAGSTASESILIARLETKRLFPQSAAWAAFQLHGNGDYRLSLPRKAKPSAKEKITPAADPDPFGLQAIRVLEARNVPKPGLYRVAVSPEFQLLDVKIEVLSAEEPVLLLIHAMASKTEAAFAGLWSDVHREQWNAISSVYGESIFCFEHWGLSKSPVENALALVRTLPPGLRIHMISLSSGGLMAELLCRGQRVNGPPVDEVDLKGFPSEQGHVLEQLGRELSERQLQIERFIRIACPVRGTSYPMRSKQILGKVAKALRYVGVVINNIILAQFEAIADPQKIPGLRAIYPDSPLIAMLNRTDVHLEGDLSIVAGTYRPQSITGKLTAKITDLLLAEDNDLVVPTESMYGGSERLTPARFVHFEGSQINHFSYFEQREVVNTIVGRLLEREVGTVWKAVTYESTEIPTLLVIYDPGIDNTVNVDQCAAALAPLENQGLVRLSFSEMQQLAELKTKSLLLSVLQTTRLALVLVTPELLASKGLQVALEYLQPRANNDECKIMPIIFGEVDWKKSALINYQALRIDGTEEREQGHDNAAWQILVNHVITYLPSIVPKPVVNGEKATVDGDE